ncbi:MAG: superoxide dismutase family protein [Labilithrix sp.]|nr:superoxide dismutase family protein [Labilithrix sp.]MCW5836253.1 superoxide dismutase family protein [Labilithrix sp.]
MASAGACKSSEPEEASDPKPPGIPFVPPTFDDDAGAATPTRDTDGWLLLDPGAPQPTLVTQAIATLQPTKGNKAAGTVRLSEMTDGLRIRVAFSGLTFLAKYTVRVHVFGDCSSEDGASAGPAFNFDGSSLSPQNPNAAMGNLGELQADVSGNAKGEGKVDLPALQGAYSIVGRAIVLHGTSNDPANAGVEGPRLACGVIGIFAD